MTRWRDHDHGPAITTDERWRDAVWPFVREQAPPAPASVVEIGCGPLGGFVPMLRAAGYDAVGVDTEAPEGAGYQRTGIEDYLPPAGVELVIASRSLHHVADLDDVADRMADMLAPGGTAVVLEWAWERWDEATAQWCFERLPPAADDHNWLHKRRDAWVESGQPWEAYLSEWATDEGLHPGSSVLAALEARLHTVTSAVGAYYFPGLEGVAEEAELVAIDSGRIQANGIRFVGRTAP
ncbi:MAG: methyltransferase domain-containing protein [Sporichthyaceae bacterium]